MRQTKLIVFIISFLCVALLSGCNGDKKEIVDEEQEDHNENLEENEQENELLEENEISEEQKSDEILFLSVTFDLLENGTSIGEFKIDFRELETEFAFDNGRVTIILNNLFPDFYMNDGEPDTKSRRLVNPGFVFTVFEEEDYFEGLFIGIGKKVLSVDDPIFDIEIIDLTTVD